MSAMFDAVQAGNRQPLWQAFGKTFATNISVTDGLNEINGDFEILKMPQYGMLERDGKRIAVRAPNKFTLFGDTPDGMKYYGTCSDSYQLMQRRDIARVLDDLTLRWPLETIGLVNNGKTMVVVLNAGEMEINGDPIILYFMAIDTVNGGTSMKLPFTPIRLHCTNALVSSVRHSVVTAKFEHRTKYVYNVENSIKLTKQMADVQIRTIQNFQYMADRILTPEQAMRIFKAAYPDPKRSQKIGILDIVDKDDEEFSDIREAGEQALKTFEYYKNRTEELRETAFSLFEKISDEYPNIGGTAYAAYNAVVELADWRSDGENAAIDALFGLKANEKRRAFELAMKG